MLRSLIGLILLASVSSDPLFEGQYRASVDDFQPMELLELSPIPRLKSSAIAPDIGAKAAILMDYDTGLVLYKKNSDEQMAMASLTKIMTAIIILENHALDEVVTVGSNFSGIEGVKIWIRQYEQLYVEDLLKALLIRSAGDAAMALAEYHSGSVEAFVEEMNERARTLNLTDTHFENPIGLDADDHYSTAFDLAILSKHALHMSAFRSIVGMEEARIESVDRKIDHYFKTTNKLLGSYLNILGVKTGTTYAAGESLINLARNEAGREVIAVLLNSPDRFQENKSMIDWAFRSHEW
ncbi:MAG: D-alanyl-D-alanine carboxypeptidase [Candidatus Peregrinibacteria bacterium]|nr:D-alanyl-D-alanine carboxypeptidase [Candidatus Peregrinibacteria bacterium]